MAHLHRLAEIAAGEKYISKENQKIDEEVGMSDIPMVKKSKK